MTSETAFPDWVEESLRQNKSKLVPKIGNRIDTCREEFQCLLNTLDIIPENITLPEPTKNALRIVPGSFGPTHYGCRYWVDQWFFRHAYRIRGYLRGLKYAMESGNWLVGVSCLRNVFEEIIYFDYHLKTVKICVQEIDALGKFDNIKGKKKNRKQEEWRKSYTELHQKIIKCIFNSLQGTSINWKGYTSDILEGSDINHNELNVNDMQEVKKIHINDCIRNANKQYPQLRIKYYYGNLSEMCHPNIGSNMFVFVNRVFRSKNFSEGTFSSNSETYSGVSMFFEMTCEPMISAFLIENKNLPKAKEILCRYHHLAKYNKDLMDRLCK